MIVVQIKNAVWAELGGLEEELEQIRILLTLVDDSAIYSYRYKTGNWDGKRHLYSEDRKGGWLLVRVGLLDWLISKSPAITFKVLNHIQPLSPGDLWRDTLLPLRPFQEKALLEVFRWQRGLLSMATNAGKTLIALAILKGFQDYKCLFLVHRLELFRQAVEYFRDIGTLEVGTIAAGKESNLEANICVGMIGTLYSRVTRQTRIKEYLKNINVVIVDECHHVGAEGSYAKVLDTMTNAFVRVGLSGTCPPEESCLGLSLKGTFGDMLYEITNEDLRVLDVSALAKVKFLVGNWHIEGLKESARQVFVRRGRNPETRYWTYVYENGIVRNTERNLALILLVKALLATGESGILIIVDRLEHGTFIYDGLKDTGAVRYVFGESEDRLELFEAFREGRISCLISSPILGEGINIVGIKHVFLAGAGKSKRKMLQRIGRGLRKKKDLSSLVVYDFDDNCLDIPLLQRHTEQRKEICIAEGFEVEEVKI